MKYASLGSGSRGNCTVVASTSTTLLVDCGFGGRETESRLLNKGVDPHSVDAVFVTHEHSDHHRGVGPFARRFGTRVYGTKGTLSRIDVKQCPTTEIDCGVSINVGDLMVHPVAVPHDAREPSQFVIESHARRIGILTDIGSLTEAVVDHYQYCDSLFIEANHDTKLLWNGSYPYPLKQRIAGDRGHLSNDQTIEFVRRVQHSHLQSLVLGHLSQENNDPEIVRECFQHLGRRVSVLVASQEAGTDWIDVS